jgi:exopolyphosphatase/guanosine-5'-triphosphate,3'-diphosphate pyrophosphatase
MGRVFAAADIGSNTAHLLVAEVGDRRLIRIANESDWLGLGEIVAREGSLPAESIARLCSTLSRFTQVSNSYRAEKMYVFATEAVRIAENHTEALAEIERATGLQVDVITGRREAELSALGATLDTPLEGNGILFEVGGGSAQIAVLDGANVEDVTSVPVGTGRLHVAAGLEPPVDSSTVSAAEVFVESAIAGVPRASGRAIASGGVARGLVRSLHPDGEQELFVEELDYVVWTCSRLRVDTIALRFGVREKRARALLPGAIVYRCLMKTIGLRSMVVSDYGVREGAILEMALGKVPACR